MHTPSIVLCATWAPLTAADVAAFRRRKFQ